MRSAEGTIDASVDSQLDEISRGLTDQADAANDTRIDLKSTSPLCDS